MTQLFIINDFCCFLFNRFYNLTHMGEHIHKFPVVSSNVMLSLRYHLKDLKIIIKNVILLPELLTASILLVPFCLLHLFLLHFIPFFLSLCFGLILLFNFPFFLSCFASSYLVFPRCSKLFFVDHMRPILP